MLSAFMGLLAYMARYLGTRERGKVNCSQAFEAFNDVGLHTWAPAGGSKGERSLPPGKLKKKV